MALTIERPVLRLRGTSTPPDDLLLAAHKTLGDHFDEFLRRYGPQFTGAQLVAFTEELRNGTRP